MKPRTFARITALVLAATLASTAARAQVPRTISVPSAQNGLTADSALEARTSAVAAQLRCPVCQGLSIQDSPSELAQSMRAVARDQLAQGKSPDEVKAYFVSKYGEWILLAPKPSGINVLAYLLPVLIILGGGALLVIAVSRWTRAPEQVAEP